METLALMLLVIIIGIPSSQTTVENARCLKQDVNELENDLTWMGVLGQINLIGHFCNEGQKSVKSIGSNPFGIFAPCLCDTQCKFYHDCCPSLNYSLNAYLKTSLDPVLYTFLLNSTDPSLNIHLSKLLNMRFNRYLNINPNSSFNQFMEIYGWSHYVESHFATQLFALLKAIIGRGNAVPVTPLGPSNITHYLHALNISVKLSLLSVIKTSDFFHPDLPNQNKFDSSLYDSFDDSLKPALDASIQNLVIYEVRSDFDALMRHDKQLLLDTSLNASLSSFFGSSINDTLRSSLNASLVTSLNAYPPHYVEPFYMHPCRELMFRFAPGTVPMVSTCPPGPASPRGRPCPGCDVSTAVPASSGTSGVVYCSAECGICNGDRDLEELTPATTLDTRRSVFVVRNQGNEPPEVSIRCHEKYDLHFQNISLSKPLKDTCDSGGRLADLCRQFTYPIYSLKIVSNYYNIFCAFCDVSICFCCCWFFFYQFSFILSEESKCNENELCLAYFHSNSFKKFKETKLSSFWLFSSCNKDFSMPKRHYLKWSKMFHSYRKVYEELKMQCYFTNFCALLSYQRLRSITIYL